MRQEGTISLEFRPLAPWAGRARVLLARSETSDMTSPSPQAPCRPHQRRPSRKVIGVDADRCVLCGRCVEACPSRALFMLEVRRAAGTSGERVRVALMYQDQACSRCLLCVRACPSGACHLARPPDPPRGEPRHRCREEVLDGASGQVPA